MDGHEFEDLKEKIYELIAVITKRQPPEAAALNNIEPELLKQAKKNGLMVNQFLDALPYAVDALKLIEKIETGFKTERPQRVVLGEFPAQNPIEACADYLYKKKVRWESAQYAFKLTYFKKILDHHPVHSDAAKVMGVGMGTVLRWSKKI